MTTIFSIYWVKIERGAVVRPPLWCWVMKVSFKVVKNRVLGKKSFKKKAKYFCGKKFGKKKQFFKGKKTFCKNCFPCFYVGWIIRDGRIIRKIRVCRIYTPSIVVMLLHAQGDIKAPVICSFIVTTFFLFLWGFVFKLFFFSIFFKILGLVSSICLCSFAGFLFWEQYYGDNDDEDEDVRKIFNVFSVFYYIWMKIET